MSRRARIVLGVVAAVAFVVVLLTMTMYASISGGWDDAFRRKKSETDSDVRAAREKAEPEQVRRTEQLMASVRAALGPALRNADEREPRSECYEGRHDWKNDDEYDVRCVYITNVEVSIRAGGASRRDALHQRLVRDGWSVDGGSGIGENTGFALYDAPGFQLQIQVAAGTLELTLRHPYFEG